MAVQLAVRLAVQLEYNGSTTGVQWQYNWSIMAVQLRAVMALAQIVMAVRLRAVMALAQTCTFALEILPPSKQCQHVSRMHLASNWLLSRRLAWDLRMKCEAESLQCT